jgi:hypothetical protein
MAQRLVVAVVPADLSLKNDNEKLALDDILNSFEIF